MDVSRKKLMSNIHDEYINCWCGCGTRILQWVKKGKGQAVQRRRFVKGHGKRLANKLNDPHEYPDFSLTKPNHCPRCVTGLMRKEAYLEIGHSLEVAECFNCGHRIFPEVLAGRMPTLPLAVLTEKHRAIKQEAVALAMGL